MREAEGRPRARVAAPFRDVADGAAYRAALDWAWERGIAAGVSPVAFAPEAVCTRAQAAAFLWRATGRPAAQRLPLVDVPSDAYYTAAAHWLAGRIVLQDGAFAPDAAVTIGQFSALIRVCRGGGSVMG